MSTSPRKDSHLYKVGDYVWVDAWQWDGEIKRIIGRITEIEINDAGVQWYWLVDSRGKRSPYCAKENQITPVTDSELAWFLVTNENWK